MDKTVQEYLQIVSAVFVLSLRTMKSASFEEEIQIMLFMI